MTDERRTLAELRKIAAEEESAAGVGGCPDCGCRDFRVTNVWTNKDGSRRRLKKCRHCGRPVHTTEVVDG